MRFPKLTRKNYFTVFIWFSSILWAYIAGHEHWINPKTSQALITAFGWLWIAMLLAFFMPME